MHQNNDVHTSDLRKCNISNLNTDTPAHLDLFGRRQALEAIGGPKVLMKCLQLLRSRTVVAAFGERPMSLLALLQASPYLSNLGMIHAVFLL